MQGLEIGERYFWKYGDPLIKEKFPDSKDRIAAGLVGEGSECYGYDDEISRDHDWGPGFCLWLTKQDYVNIGQPLQEELGRLPPDFEGIAAREESEWGKGRLGVFEIGAFYRKFIGFDNVPASNRQWRVVPENYLAAATNGKVFSDPLGEFTGFREKLKGFYPEDIRLKKIASRCMSIAQLGQYNFDRSVRRKEFVAIRYIEGQFCAQVISMVFLLNRRYVPFYKWMHRAVQELPVLGDFVYRQLTGLVTIHSFEKKNELIEEVCSRIAGELRTEGLSDSPSDFLLDHGPVVQGKIQDPEIRNMNVWVE